MRKLNIVISRFQLDTDKLDSGSGGRMNSKWFPNEILWGECANKRRGPEAVHAFFHFWINPRMGGSVSFQAWATAQRMTASSSSLRGKQRVSRSLRA